ncbi:Ribonuclease H-like superfamily protein [Rhynchospora pubera]|uniref:Ribonuclease H-like superfamily protein n=1 Tax=Rhynchospora pubera TaxID=906938 RepID=A0AAV8DHM5_9POAL|nr:Ribonuclease H-like superfamily protein [Rhynchospora pubera]
MGFWRAINVNGTIQIWRQAVRLRDFFKLHVKWRVADGEAIEAMSQPWFPGWEVTDRAPRADRRITVADLFDFDSDQWKHAKIASLIGQQNAHQIVQHADKPRRVSGLKDRLIWECTKSGRYTVKEGYNCIISRLGMQGGDISWKHVWQWKMIVPKVRMFMWRLLSNALPLAQNLSYRIRTISSMCQRCNQENEFATHCMFFCQGSRMIWFMGELGLRTDDLPLNITEAILHITQGMNEDQISTVCYTLWEIWLARNDALFQYEPFQPVAICKRVNAWKKRENQGIYTRSPSQIPIIPYEFQVEGWQVVTDASWDTSCKAGIGFLAYRAGILQWVNMECLEAEDLFQVEAIAVKNGIDWIKERFSEEGLQKVQIFSDCYNLTSAVQERNMDDLPSWRLCQLLQR